jgi:hypothetical protein
MSLLETHLKAAIEEGKGSVLIRARDANRNPLNRVQKLQYAKKQYPADHAEMAPVLAAPAAM